jgi:integrase/recombinase XerC
MVVPAAIAGAGDTAVRRFLEFFAATIRNKNTRMAYYRATTDFFAWLDAAGIVALVDIEPLHVATYIEALQERMAKPTVKQHLAAIRMLFDWLVTGAILASNPATSVRGPKHVIKRGKTPVLTTDQARVLIESIDTSTLVGLRDRALIGVMTYAFARIGAVVSMRVEDYFANGKRWWVRLHEKGGKRHEMPAHHKLEAFLDEYMRVEDDPAPRADLSMRAKIGCHTFRVAGITAYLEAGGSLETPRPWRCTKVRAPPSSMIARAMKLHSMRLNASRFEGHHAGRLLGTGFYFLFTQRRRGLCGHAAKAA